jgi:hypothetical protein
MKKIYLAIGIVVILAFVCSPVLAISKADLISQYKGQSSPTIPTPVPPASPSNPSRPSIPTPAPTQNPQTSWWFFGWSDIFYPKSDYMSYLHGSIKAKPNIYLYSNRDLTAQVRLAPESAITVSDPVYQPGEGWRAEIRNGSLNGKGDFLFYEARESGFEWQMEEGYIIRASSREQDMASMLGQYGFNEKETAEFIDYWASHLIENMDFVFYPQETAAVNQDLLLSVIPEPDHVMRILFKAEPLMSAPEPVTSPERIVREGFYVVEWGVIIDGEYWINHSPASPEVLL